MMQSNSPYHVTRTLHGNWIVKNCSMCETNDGHVSVIYDFGTESLLTRNLISISMA